MDDFGDKSCSNRDGASQANGSLQQRSALKKPRPCGQEIFNQGADGERTARETDDAKISERSHRQNSTLRSLFPTIHKNLFAVVYLNVRAKTINFQMKTQEKNLTARGISKILSSDTKHPLQKEKSMDKILSKFKTFAVQRALL